VLQSFCVVRSRLVRLVCQIVVADFAGAPLVVGSSQPLVCDRLRLGKLLVCSHALLRD